MTEEQVHDSIAKDFKAGKEQIKRIENTIEKTTSLALIVDSLIPESGAVQVAYVFGFKSKKLVQINVQWGWPASKNTGAEKIVAAANILRQHFASQEFNSEGLMVNVPISQENVIVFRGQDEKGRMVLLNLASGQATDEEKAKGAGDGVRGERGICVKGNYLPSGMNSLVGTASI